MTHSAAMRVRRLVSTSRLVEKPATRVPFVLPVVTTGK